MPNMLKKTTKNNAKNIWKDTKAQNKIMFLNLISIVRFNNPLSTNINNEKTIPKKLNEAYPDNNGL
jgi:hypothetical protein